MGGNAQPFKDPLLTLTVFATRIGPRLVEPYLARLERLENGFG